MTKSLKPKIRTKHHLIGVILLLTIMSIVFYTENKHSNINTLKKIGSPLLKERILNVNAYINAGTCYYNSGAGLASYLENVSLDDFIWYGRPARFEYNSYLIGPPGRGLMLEAFNNLGYANFHGSTNKEFYPTSHYSYPVNDDNIIFFNSETEAFYFIKRLINKEIPVLVIINEKPFTSRSKRSFKTFAGYDEKNVYLSWKPNLSAPLKEYKTIGPIAYPIDSFLEAWRMQDHIFLWFEKEGKKKSESYILEINKKDAKSAQENIQKLLNSIEERDPKIFNENGTIRTNQSETAQTLSHFYEDGALTRMVMSKKFKENGYSEAAGKYGAAAELYRKKDYKLYETFPNIALLEREAAMLLGRK